MKVAMGNYLKSIQKIKGIMEIGIYKQAKDEMKNKFYFLTTQKMKQILKTKFDWNPELWHKSR